MVKIVVMKAIYKTFALPTVVSLIVLAGVYFFFGVHEFLLASLLCVLEVTLSFDNAVVNAKVLARMDQTWQKRFLTWGILIAVVGTRLVLPILIVAASVALSPILVAKLAFFSPEKYAELLEGSRVAISAFGGTFLLMVSLKYFFDEAKGVHWIHFIERHIARWGRIEAVEIALTLLVLFLIAVFVPASAVTVLSAGILGILIFILIQGIANSLEVEVGSVATAGGFALFVYLNVLDAAFSLDGVVGAFAITSQLPAIIVGLGVGAYFVRSFTVYMVREKTLDGLVYLEHGAHWAILGLAIAMFVGIFHEVPEFITGFVGLVFVGTAYFSSIRFASKK